MDSMLTIGEVSRRSGVASSALRFYDERGLITSERAGSGHRRYPRRCYAGSRLLFSRTNRADAREIGQELAQLPAGRVPTRRDWARLSGEWTNRIDQRIAELQRLKAGLTECIGCGCLSIDRCNLAIRPISRAMGSGPRYWVGFDRLTWMRSWGSGWATPFLTPYDLDLPRSPDQGRRDPAPVRTFDGATVACDLGHHTLALAIFAGRRHDVGGGQGPGPEPSDRPAGGGLGPRAGAPSARASRDATYDVCLRSGAGSVHSGRRRIRWMARAHELPAFDRYPPRE